MNKFFLVSIFVFFLLVGCTNTPAPTPVPLAITDVSPECGVPGETVIITGTSFGDIQESSVVTFNPTSHIF